MEYEVSNTPLPELKSYLNEYHATNGKMVHSEISIQTNFREKIYDKRSNHSTNIYDGMYDIKYHDFGISLIDKPAKLLQEFGSDRRFLNKIFKDADAVYKSEKFIQYQKLPQLKSNPVMNSFENSVTAKLQTQNWFKKMNSMKMRQSFADRLRQEQNLSQTDLDDLRNNVSIRSRSQSHFVPEKLTTSKTNIDSFVEQSDKFFVTE